MTIYAFPRANATNRRFARDAVRSAFSHHSRTLAEPFVDRPAWFEPEAGDESWQHIGDVAERLMRRWCIEAEADNPPEAA